MSPRERPRSRRTPPLPVRVQPARRIALDVLRAVRVDDAYANLLLPQRIREAGLSGPDAGLATELTYGTLRMRGYYDRVIALAADRPTSEIDPAVLDVLELGCHQLLTLRTATHAAVNESVELAREVASRSATGFVNGVLRGISRRDAEEWRRLVLDDATDHDDRLAAEFSHPEWVVRAFRRALAADATGRDDESIESELRELLAADNLPPRVTLVALPGLSDVHDLPGATPTGVSPIAALAAAGDPAASPAVAAGTARVQDEGSQLAALTLSRARPVEAGERWLDLCAGPGGKTALLGAEAELGGAVLVANEPVHARAGLVRHAVAALPARPEVLELDGTVLGEREPASFDRILVDAPCSGLGALRRRPEARWRKQPGDLAELASLQERLLDSAITALKPGGLLAYVTCSPHVAETRAQVRGLLRRWSDGIEQLDAQEVVERVTGGSIELGARSPSVQLWPHRNATDAMFITLFRRL
ncbi:rRNA cytosine-C5-methyltransferase [Cnuibacter physcomitrellae]|uniref:Methyltransferase n=1 Tax=Cnuibacter physcomitrellae TaxID=1619308 RepID=A0A1X9LJL5_9MICO|nr:transcription antitermination factor NusB [Cnuibacter physcomitrellae]ARJ05395.1 methyltransferase [Cnuibacter physcomitrellae]GGI35609.1 rRNA cytosine-C5-methyltransferase [Cnuibacter physcomitrellae]